jgi:hypothetical protein
VAWSFWNTLGRHPALAIHFLPLEQIAGDRAADRRLAVFTARKHRLADQAFTDYGKSRGIEVKFVSDDGPPLIRRPGISGRPLAAHQ